MPVSSSSVATIGYDIESQVLELEYHNGGVYQYQGVPPAMHDQLMNPPSIGTFVNQQIKKFYVVNRVG
jgi:hypothetical protein